MILTNEIEPQLTAQHTLVRLEEGRKRTAAFDKAEAPISDVEEDFEGVAIGLENSNYRRNQTKLSSVRFK